MNCSNSNIPKITSPIKSKFSILSQNGSLQKIQNEQYSSTNLQESMHIIPRKLSPKPKTHFKQISNINSLQHNSKLQTSTIIPINKVLRSGSSPNKNMIMTSPSKSIQCSNNQNWVTKSNVRYLPVNINLCQQNNNINHCQQNNKSIIRIFQEKSLSKKNMTNSNQNSQTVLNSPLKLVHLSPSKIKIGNAFTSLHQNASENIKIQNILPSNLSKINSVKVINKINQSMISTQRQNQLQRKVKFLQCRIAQLYQQRQQLQFKLNQENIKLQYQNKHLLTQLQHSLHQKSKYLHYQNQDLSPNCSSQTCKCKDADNMLKQLQKSEENQYHQSKQIHALKASLNQVQDMLSKQIDKSLQLLEELQNKDKFYCDQANQIQDLKKKNSELTSQNLNLTKKIQSSIQLKQQNLILKNQGQKRMYQECLQQKENMYKNLIEQLKSNLNASQNKSKQDLEELKKQMLQTATRNSEIIKYYQQKLEQYMLKIQTLERQVGQYQAQMTQIKINFNVLKELQQNNNCLVSQLKLFRQQKNDLEAQLCQKQKSNDFMVKQIEKFTFTIAQMNRQALDKQKCVQELNFDISHKDKALVELKRRTEELVIQLQESLARQQKLKMSNSNGFSKGNNTTLSSGSCQKCQQLRKTIFKLNNHLNRSSYTSQSMIQSKVSTNNKLQI